MRQILPLSWRIENTTIAVATSKNTSSEPSRIIPPASPNTPETKEAASTAVPIARMAVGVRASMRQDTSGRAHHRPDQHGRAHQIDRADKEDDRPRPLPKTVIGHAFEHEWRGRRTGDRQHDR